MPDTDNDPFLWLEDIDGEKALDWVRKRNAESAAILETGDDFESLKQRLLSIYQSREKIPHVTARGEHLYNFWQDETHARGLWRRTTLESYRTAEPKWETALDLDAVAAAEGENWVWKGPIVLEPDFDRALLRLSRGGGDAVVIREFDLKKLVFVEGGFEVPEAKSNASWLDRDTLLVGTDFGEGSLTESGYPRTSRFWKRGTPLREAELIFEGKTADVSAGAYAFWHRGERRRVAYRSLDFFHTEEFLWHDGGWVRIEKPDDVEFSLAGDHLLFHPRKDWVTPGRTWAADSLLAMKTERFLAGERDFDLLYEPKPRSAYKGYEVTASAIIINELAEVRDRFTVARFTDEDGWSLSPLATPGEGSVHLSAYDSETSDRYWAIVTDFLTPTTLYLCELDSAVEPERLKSLPDFFDTGGLTIEQHHAGSADGTKVPYFLVRPEKMEYDGTHPTLLYGYGGFEVTMESSYSATVGAAWLEKGGIYVLANIRGGGEFGPAWHQAALQENRQRAYDDFIAVAEDLIARGITSPDHLGIMGGSNGGLLTGNMLVQRPDLFGAIVSAVPLLDMRRFHKLLAGASWVAEYGNPDDPEHWTWLENYSPYHKVKPDVDYPPVLFATSTRDDRVHPGHARKMVARMREQGHENVHYYENIEGGHGGAANLVQSAHLNALEYSFLWRFLEKA